jgi:hypothetical protein
MPLKVSFSLQRLRFSKLIVSYTNSMQVNEGGYTTMMIGQTIICGAKTRQGNCCGNIPMENGRCRMHGGKSKGPLNPKLLKRNKNATGNKARLITGEYETITWATLTDFEREHIRKQYKINTEVKQIKKTHLDKWVKSYFIELVNDEFIGEFEDWKEKDDIPESIITFGKLIVKLANNEIISGLSVILVHYANELVEKDKVFSQEIKINDIYEGLYHSSCFGISGNIIILNIIN